MPLSHCVCPRTDGNGRMPGVAGACTDFFNSKASLTAAAAQLPRGCPVCWGSCLIRAANGRQGIWSRVGCLQAKGKMKGVDVHCSTRPWNFRDLASVAALARIVTVPSTGNRSQDRRRYPASVDSFTTGDPLPRPPPPKSITSTYPNVPFPCPRMPRHEQ